MNRAIMGHVVAGFPNEQDCLELLLGMQHKGIAAIEVQVPFSDPSADGPVIMSANDVSLTAGMTIEKTFALIATARNRGLTVPVYVMTYVNKMHFVGASDLCRYAKQSGVRGFIIPDLPFDSDDFMVLTRIASNFDISLIPVLSPGISDERLAAIMELDPTLVYLTSMRGITGKKLVVTAELQELVRRVRNTKQSQIAVGFGIRTIHDVEQVLRVADMAVVGSAVIEEIVRDGVIQGLALIQSLVMG